MKNLPSIESYSKTQIDEACAFSKILPDHLKKTEFSEPWGLRHRTWCESFLAEFHQLIPTESISQRWAEVADAILRETADRIFSGCELAMFAFGKLGSQELNLSSDVDLLFVSKESSDQITQKVRYFQKFLSETTENGFIFRVDYELRPGGKAAPLVPTLDQVMDYYGNYGETWERMAFIRLRPLWGNSEITQEMITFRKKFSFRKHLDYGLLEDLNLLRNKMHAFAKTKERPGFIDLKLGLGGIRDIELFCHALQVIHGGRNLELHTGNTTKALETISLHSILPKADCHFLTDFFWRLRHFENLVQGQFDQQIHFLDTQLFSPSEVEELHSKMQQAALLVSGLLGSIKSNFQRMPDGIDEQKSWLEQLGFSKNEIESSWEDPTTLPILSRQKERDLEQRSQFLVAVLSKMGKSSATPQRLFYLREFLQAIRAKSSFYSLLLKNESLLEILSEIFCTSPFLSRLLCSRPEILDSLVMRNIEALNPDGDWGDFLQGLADMKQLTEFIAGADFLRTLNLEKLLETLSQVADDVVTRLWQKVRQEFNCSEVSILSLGKWGGRELGVFSDLDCIFVKQGEPDEKDLKALRRFINRLTEAHRGGALYSIDTRLRTADQTGVLITSHENLFSHFKSALKPWERQAYLKSRDINGSNSIVVELQNEIAKYSFTNDELLELNRIRRALLANAKNEWDLKYQEGGLIDSELAVQAAFIQFQLRLSGSRDCSLEHLVAALAAHSNLWVAKGPALLENYRFMRVVEQIHRLVSEESHPLLLPEKETFSQIATQLHLSADELKNRLRSALRDQTELLKSLDPRRGSQ